MSKELEPIEALDKLLDGYSRGMAGRSYYDIVREALERLEAIKNANPSEALEAFGRITLHTEYDNDSHYDGLHFEDDCKLVDKALEFLEAIENANPSEALESLEEIYDKIRLSQYLGVVESAKLKTNYNIVKRYILKEQERKKYLKWKDLDFGYGSTKVLKVRMNDTVYKLFYRFFDNTDEVQLLSEDEKSVYFIFTGKFKDNIKLFNDLHLEVVDNE